MAKRLIDRRVARTTATLHEALLALIAEKGYEAITVEAICRRANVGRSTFYAHYTSKDDLMRSGLKNLRNKLFDRQREAPERRNSKGRGLTFSLSMFEHARDHLHLHCALAGSRGGMIAHDTIRQTLSDVVRTELSATAGENAKDAMPRELVVQYLVGACMAVVTWWLDGGVTITPQQIDGMFQRLATEGIASLR